MPILQTKTLSVKEADLPRIFLVLLILAEPEF